MLWIASVKNNTQDEWNEITILLLLIPVDVFDYAELR